MRNLFPGVLEPGWTGGRKTTPGELAASLPWRLLWPKAVYCCLPNRQGSDQATGGLALIRVEVQ